MGWTRGRREGGGADTRPNRMTSGACRSACPAAGDGPAGGVTRARAAGQSWGSGGPVRCSTASPNARRRRSTALIFKLQSPPPPSSGSLSPRRSRVRLVVATFQYAQALLPGSSDRASSGPDPCMAAVIQGPHLRCLTDDTRTTHSPTGIWLNQPRYVSGRREGGGCVLRQATGRVSSQRQGPQG